MHSGYSKEDSTKTVYWLRSDEKKDLIRILKTQDESIVIDATGRKNGRGAYICANEDCLSKAFKNKGLERSFKMAVDSAVYDELAKELNNIGK